MVKQFILLSGACLLLSACGSPRSALDQAITDAGYIPFNLPMPSTRVGTMLHGNNNNLYLEAPPETCFPDLPGNKALRYLQPTDLPSQYQNVQFGFDASISPVLGAGNSVINFKFGLNYVKTVQVQFKNPTIEFLNESNFQSYFNNGMSAYCKSLITTQNYPFIVQGLRIDSMSFTFQDQSGANLDISGILSQLVNFAPGVSWQLQDKYTLVVNTPKYIGYRMAEWDGQPGIHLLYASTVDGNGNWVFQNIDQPTQQAPQVQMIQLGHAKAQLLPDVMMQAQPAEPLLPPLD